MRGTLSLEGKLAAPHNITAPVLSMVDEQCSIVPPQAVLPFHEAVQSSDTRLLWYRGDTGVALQHVGFLVGKNAHQHIWPEAIRWMHAHWSAAHDGHSATRATSE
jgi:polyhydroxyalkanoate synthase